MPNAVPALERLFLSVPEACAVIGCGRTRFYQKVKSGELDVTKDGKRTLVPVATLKAYAASRLEAA